MTRQQRAAWVDGKGRAWVVEEDPQLLEITVRKDDHSVTAWSRYAPDAIEATARFVIAQLRGL